MDSTIQKMAKKVNKHTELRRQYRVSSLLQAGYSKHQIRSMVKASKKELEIYIKEANEIGDYSAFRKRQFGVEFGNKTQPYYPADEFDELEAWEIPKYSFEELSDEEKNFYNNYTEKREDFKNLEIMNKIAEENGLPAPLLEQKQVITQEERDQLIHFNTKAYWHCFYDPKTDKLYNEYCRLIMENGFSYLLGLNLIDENRNQITYFEK